MATTFCLVRFSKKSGKIDTTLEGESSAMLSCWALLNTTKTKACIVFDKADGKVTYMTEGTEAFPTVRDGKHEDLGNVEEYCVGLLAAVQ